MAKSARASSKKAARSRIRGTLYAPAEQARLERLSARLMASIAQPSAARPSDAGHMEEDDLADATTRQEQRTEDQAFRTVQQGSTISSTNMDIDESSTSAKPKTSSYKISKPRKRKANTKSILFNTRKHGSKKGGASKASKRTRK